MGRAGQSAEDWELEELAQHEADLAAADQLAWTLEGMNKVLTVEAAVQKDATSWDVVLRCGDTTVVVQYVFWVRSDPPYKKRALETLLWEASCAVRGFENYCLRFDHASDDPAAKLAFLKCEQALQGLRSLFGAMADEVAEDYALYWKELTW
jgi:hypothetical protein